LDFLLKFVGVLPLGGDSGAGLNVDSTFSDGLFESDIAISFGGGVGGVGSKSGSVSE
jgi:hypothetical protein